MTKGRFRSISNRFGLALIGVISLVLLAFAVAAIAVNLDRSERQLQSKLDASLRVAEVALRIPIWNVDYFSAQGIVDALLLDPQVVYADVAVDGVPVALQRREGTPGGDFELLIEDPSLMTGMITINYENEEIGVLQVALSRASIRQAAWDNAIAIVLLTLLIICAIAITTWLISRRYVAQPMARLQNSASAIAQGELDTKIAIDRNDEIGQLASDFDSMRQSVKGLFGELQEANQTLEERVEERTKELAEVSERLSLALQIDDVGIYDADFKADTLWWSPEYTAMLGHDPNTYQPIPPTSWEERLHPDTADRTMSEMARFLNGNEKVKRLRQRMRRADDPDREIWLDAVMRVQRDDAGEPTRLTGLAVDITEQLQREQKLADANRQIVESLHYARRIQSAMLPAQDAIDQATDQHFLIWEPRDIVGGDFFWHHPVQGGYAIIVGDCTGHGVPGAFMTLITCGLLDRTLQAGVDSPSRLLGSLHGDLQTLLGQDAKQGDTDDGLDAGVCFVSEAERKVVFSGARFSLFHTAHGDLEELRGDKAGLGYRRYAADTAFTDKVVDMQDDSRFFMTTDGLIDQIGGPKRRSFGKRRFLKALNETLASPLDDQGDHLKAIFSTYQGSENRRDDVTVLGFAPSGV
ncbi:MAG: SpoIIE family protein phosphatase [Pseudomonadota bacterium]